MENSLFASYSCVNSTIPFTNSFIELFESLPFANAENPALTATQQ